jgi:hypothetical protein
MESAEFLFRRLIDDSVIFERRLPTHATDQTYCFHLGARCIADSFLMHERRIAILGCISIARGLTAARHPSGGTLHDSP